jgi:diaminohydroxyphosphoribosylaminopyrimidine deaminase/5-amino-6-(5-phosphoribosylamino)uracil reductase
MEGGINVTVGFLKTNAMSLINDFLHEKKKRPYIILKWAESQDGFIA